MRDGGPYKRGVGVDAWGAWDQRREEGKSKKVGKVAASCLTRKADAEERFGFICSNKRMRDVIADDIAMMARNATLIMM